MENTNDFDKEQSEGAAEQSVPQEVVTPKKVVVPVAPKAPVSLVDNSVVDQIKIMFRKEIKNKDVIFAEIKCSRDVFEASWKEATK